MVKEGTAEKGVAAATEDLKYLTVDKIPKTKRFNIQGRIVKSYSTCRLNCRHYKIRPLINL